MPQRYFSDTSALIVRFLGGAIGRGWMEQICDPISQNEVILAEITGAEIAAAMYQLVRGGTLKKRRCEQGLRLFWNEIDAGFYNIVPITPLIVRRAAGLCASHALRGYDAVQLACALAFRDDARQADAIVAAVGGVPLGDPIVLTEDARLRDAALAEGFVVDSPKNHP